MINVKIMMAMDQLIHKALSEGTLRLGARSEDIFKLQVNVHGTFVTIAEVDLGKQITENNG